MEKRRVIYIIEWVIALAACGWLVWKLATYEDYAALGECLRSMSWPQWIAIAVCVALMPVNMALEAWRWKTLAFANRRAKVYTTPLNKQAADASALPTGHTPLAPVEDPFDMSFSEAQRQVYYSKLAGLITPWRLGEYPARGILMNERVSELGNERIWPKVLSMGAVGSATMTVAIVATGLVSLEVLGVLGILGVLGGLDSLEKGSYFLLAGAVLLLLILALVLAPRLLRR